MQACSLSYLRVAFIRDEVMYPNSLGIFLAKQPLAPNFSVLLWQTQTQKTLEEASALQMQTSLFQACICTEWSDSYFKEDIHYGYV